MRIEALRINAVAGDEAMALMASPEPGARVGRSIRFNLSRLKPGSRETLGSDAGQASHVPAGYALASIFVAADHVRTVRPLSRGESFVDADLVATRGEVGAVLLQRLPRPSDIVGARVVRDLVTGEVVTRSTVEVRPTVRSGDVVAVRTSVGPVMVQTQAVAEQSGLEGDMIRVVNRESRRALKARVVGPGQVEVVQ
ncbi:MAG TPA: flagellar basal body P-ring formation chaperone FlgA [Vicinamibacterales bacterium]